MFLSGEKVYLDSPRESDFEVWASWFNDQKITRYLHYGEIPNSIQQQKKFYEQAVNNGSIILMIRSKKTNELKGTISLSKIDLKLKCADLALVAPVRLSDAPLGSLEAISLIVSHAFEILGLERVYAEQNFPGLINWTSKMQILGFQIDGFKKKTFYKNGIYENSVFISITKEDFNSIKQFRGGTLWPGELEISNIIKEKQNAIKESILELYQLQISRQDALLTNLLSPKTEQQLADK
jgi:RimJ/RimL family protein N-acetyltransferase